MRRAVIIQNGAKGGPRRVGDWLRAAGVATDVVTAYDGSPVPPLHGYDAVVVLGGGFMCDNDVRAPWLPATRALVREALDGGTPVLGICLGGQLLAHVAGGSVTPDAGAPEHGSVPVTIRPEAADDPLFRDLPPTVPAIEHHKDAITTVPPGAVWLASTERCAYQAFRVGATAWGVQFHPEVGPDRLLQWDAGELEVAGLDRDSLHRQAVADDAVAGAIWETVTKRFAGIVNGTTKESARPTSGRTARTTPTASPRTTPAPRP